MTSAKKDSSELSEKRAEWETWARQQIGGSQAQVRAAVNAAMRTALTGASSQETAAAARQAAASVGAAPPVAASAAAPGTAPAAPEFESPAAPATIVGYARRVQKQQQLTGHTPLQILEFQIEAPGFAPIHVQMRGVVLEGVIAEGHIVEVQTNGLRGGFLETDHVFNRSTGSDVWMKTGLSGMFGVFRAQWGRRGLRVPIYFAISVVSFFVIAITTVVIVLSVGNHNMNEQNSQYHQQWCDDAKSHGMTPMGC